MEMAGPALRRAAREGRKFVDETNLIMLRRWACELAGQTAREHPQWEAQHVAWLAQAFLELVQYGSPTQDDNDNLGRENSATGSRAEIWREPRAVRPARRRESASDIEGD